MDEKQFPSSNFYPRENHLNHPDACRRSRIGSGKDRSTSPKKSEKAAPPEMTGLEVGKQAPLFTLKNQDGKDVELRDLLKQGPVALVFYRSADW